MHLRFALNGIFSVSRNDYFNLFDKSEKGQHVPAIREYGSKTKKELRTFSACFWTVHSNLRQRPIAYHECSSNEYSLCHDPVKIWAKSCENCGRGQRLAKVIQNTIDKHKDPFVYMYIISVST